MERQRVLQPQRHHVFSHRRPVLHHRVWQHDVHLFCRHSAHRYGAVVFGSAFPTDACTAPADSLVCPAHPLHTDDSHPTPGGNGTVVAVPSQTDDLLLEDDPISMDITFFTAETAHGNENMYTYRVFYVPIVPGQPCGEDNVTATPDCILTTMCGAQAVPGSMATDWLAFPTLLGENVSVTVPNLQQNQEYSFTVAVRAPTGNVQMYTGTSGTPTYDRVGQAQSDGTILAVAGGAAGLFVLLVACIFIAKKRLDRAFQQRRLARQYKNIAPTAEAADAEAKATRNPAAGAGRST